MGAGPVLAEAAPLAEWLNPVYVRQSAELATAFASEGALQLNAALAERHVPAALALGCDAADGLSNWSVPHYGAGAQQGWRVRGPPHLRRYCEWDAAARGNSRTKLAQLGSALASIRAWMCGHVFVSWLERVCSVSIAGVEAVVRRFRPGLDYTVARHTKQRRLVATWCLVDPSPLWEDGAMGAFHVFTDADTDSSKAREAAEVYEDDGGEGRVLSVAPSCNGLSLVLCEAGQVEFVRYVSCGAPSSRVDVHCVYALH